VSGSLALEQDAFGRLVLTLEDGRRLAGVVPVRCFPFSAPGGPVAFLDESGREVWCAPALDALPDAVRAALEADLAARELVPVIQRIRPLAAIAEPMIWTVETDRGETRLQLAGDDPVRRLDAQGALVFDARGMRYRILDLRGLDAASRKALERYL
jgi:hypothetical protein